jgi:HTH-like domain
MTLVDELRDRFGVEPILRVLDVAASSFYGWVGRAAAPSDRDEEDRGLLSNIYEIWDGSGRTYGADRVHQQLRRDGIGVGRKRVERLMRGQGWQGAFLRKRWRIPSTRQDPWATPAPDRVNPHPVLAGVPVVGRGARCVLQPDRRVEDRRSLRHRPGARRAGVRDLVAAGARRAADPSQRQGIELHLVPVLATPCGQRDPGLDGVHRGQLR